MDFLQESWVPGVARDQDFDRLLLAAIDNLTGLGFLSGCGNRPAQGFTHS